MNPVPRWLTDTEKKEINKILIIQHKPFGDILLNTGYLPELRKHFLNAQIHFLIERPFVTILEDNPFLDKLMIMEKRKGWLKLLPVIKTAIQVRREKYDLIIDQLRGTSSARIVLFSGARYRLGHSKPVKKKFGFPMKKWNWLYNLTLPRGKVRYYSRFKFDLLKPLGIEEVEHNLYYHVKKESFEYIQNWLQKSRLEKKPLIIMSPGTPVLSKQWSLDYYAQLADRIQQNLKFNIMILWGPGEEKDAACVRDKMKTRGIMAPPTTLNQAAAMLHHAKVLICNDGGLNHVAVSQKVPSIAVFGPQSYPDKWCAWHRPIHMYLKDWNYKTRGDSRFNITPKMVYEKLVDHLNNKDNRNLNELAARESKEAQLQK